MNGWYGHAPVQPGRADQDRHVVIVQRPSHFGDQPGLAGARLAAQEDDLATPGDDLRPQCLERLQLERRPTMGAWRAATSRADSGGGAHGITVTSRSFAKAIEPFRSLSWRRRAEAVQSPRR